MKPPLAVVLLIALIGSSAEGQVSSSSHVIALPQGPITRIQSPNRMWTLLFECPNTSAQRVLSIENTRTGARRVVKQYERSVGIGWAPDSQRFFVNDAFASNGTEAYVYDVLTLKEISLNDVLVAADPSATQYLEAGHAYLEVTRWVNSHVVVASLWGHFDEKQRGFELKYRIDLRGGVRRLSSREF